MAAGRDSYGGTTSEIVQRIAGYRVQEIDAVGASCRASCKNRQDHDYTNEILAYGVSWSYLSSEAVR